MRIACVVEYDGVGFHGWQRQANAETVQARLECALARVADERVGVICAGRTDAGVHATGQVIHFDTTAERSARAWVMGTNSHLPPAIAVRWAAPVAADFNARRSAIARRYRYLIGQGLDRPALWRQRLGWYPQPLDRAAMRAAAHHCLGEQDFSAFRAADCQSPTPMRRIDRIELHGDAAFLTIDVTGNAFLHHMVRILVGTLVAVGRGRRPPEWVAEVLAGRDRRRAGATAVAAGLYFLGPTYPAAFAIPTPRTGTPVPAAD